MSLLDWNLDEAVEVAREDGHGNNFFTTNLTNQRERKKRRIFNHGGHGVTRRK